MNSIEEKQLLIDKCKELNINITDEMSHKFITYKSLLKSWNEKINLTAITDDTQIIIKHFVDSLSTNNYLPKNTKSIVDVGTGAGFPALPLAIINNDIDFYLVDSLNKRVKFLDEVVNELNLKNVTTIHSRTEDLSRTKEYREQIDVCVSRAVANMTLLTEYCMPLVKVGGRFIALKGSKIFEEIEDAKDIIKDMGGEIVSIEEVKLTDDMTHYVVIIDKVSKTPKVYPRKKGKSKS